MYKSLIFLGLLSLLVVSGCSSTQEEIEAAIYVCKDNGGLAFYMGDHTAVCKNDATFTNPTKAKKIMEKRDENP